MPELHRATPFRVLFGRLLDAYLGVPDQRTPRGAHLLRNDFRFGAALRSVLVGGDPAEVFLEGHSRDSSQRLS